jgi:hypothetical protein
VGCGRTRLSITGSMFLSPNGGKKGKFFCQCISIFHLIIVNIYIILKNLIVGNILRIIAHISLA